VDVIKHLSPNEKLQINEALWEGNMDIPKEHQDLVIARIESAKQNPARLLSWKDASEKLTP
jgi:hypothetical protein